MEDLLNNPYVIKALQTLAAALVVTLLTKIAMSIATRGQRPATEAPYAIKYTAIFLFGFGLIFIWLEGLGPILTTLTIVAAALTIVSKEMILNFFGSFVIFWRELFAIGDRVQVGDHSGDVIAKGLFYFTLLETGSSPSTDHSTGRLINIPNALTLTLPVINATRGAGYVWNEIHFDLTTESDWEKTRELLVEIATRHLQANGINLDEVKKSFQRRNIYYRALTPKVYVSVEAGTIRLTIRYICRSRMVRESVDYITANLLKELESGFFELARRRQ